MRTENQHTAFHGTTRLAAGSLPELALELYRNPPEARDGVPLLVFEDASGRLLDLDLSGTEADVRDRYPGPAGGSSDAAGADGAGAPRGRGRPRLGVVGREVTLLPRHWAWLEAQRGGASAALRRLVDAARHDLAHQDRVRIAQDRTQRAMTSLAGNLPGFEEACRALYACEGARFEQETADWPADVRDYVRDVAADAFLPALDG